MKKTPARMLFMAVLVIFIAGNCLADEVRLKNGDRLTGQVIRMQQGKLILKTGYAGEIGIVWQEVAGLETDRPMKVMLKDDTAMEGTAKATETGSIKLHSSTLETSAVIRLDDVKAINPEPVKTVKITARANVNITNQRGNTSSDNYDLQGEFTARTAKNRYVVGGELNKEDSEGTTISQNWLVHGDYSRFLNKKWYLFTNTLFEHDEFNDLKLRSTLGAGAGYQIFETPLVNLSISAGLAEVNESFYVAEDNTYSAGQWSVNYDQYFFDKFVQLFHRNNGYVSLENASNWFLKTRTGLRFPVYKGFGVTLQYNYDYNNQPSVDAQTREDTKFIFMLGYEFKN
jgi:putative salt-induced outer membrane protein YdiY